MKIGCIGNMNNNMFCLVRYLRDKGYDAELLLVEEFAHFLPGADSYNNEYLSYTRQLDWYEIGYWKISRDKIRTEVSQYDVIICCDRIPAYLTKAGIAIDIFIPHGGDIFSLAYYKFKSFPPKKWELGAYAQSRAQRKGIRNAKFIMYDYTNDDAEAFINNLKCKGKRLISTSPFIYYPQYTENQLKAHPSFEKAHEVRKNYELIVFHQCRHVWKSDTVSLHYKANDMLIRGFSAFVKSNPKVKSLLIMFEYGWDYEESKKLVSELNLDSHVLWLSKMNRSELMLWGSIAHIGVGELGRSWLSYGSAYEILTLSKPFLGFRKDELYLKYYDSLYPMVSVKTQEDITNTFEDLVTRKEYYSELGNQGFQWLKKYAIEKPLKEITGIVESKKTILSK